MPRHRTPAPDSVLDAILHRAVEPGNRALPLELFVQLGLGRDPTVAELERMRVLASAGLGAVSGRAGAPGRVDGSPQPRCWWRSASCCWRCGSEAAARLRDTDACPGYRTRGRGRARRGAAIQAAVIVAVVVLLGWPR